MSSTPKRCNSSFLEQKTNFFVMECNEDKELQMVHMVPAAPLLPPAANIPPPPLLPPVPPRAHVPLPLVAPFRFHHGHTYPCHQQLSSRSLCWHPYPCHQQLPPGPTTATTVAEGRGGPALVDSEVQSMDVAEEEKVSLSNIRSLCAPANINT